MKSRRESVLEKANKESSNDFQLKHQSTRTNMNLNYDNSKTLIIEMETDNQEKKDRIIITPNGLVGSLRKNREESDNFVYFGYKEPNDIVIILLYNIL